MEFAEYRSKSVKLLWQKCRTKYQLTEPELYICCQVGFSTWTVDNVCAVNWKNENPVEICANVLFDYVQEIMQ